MNTLFKNIYASFPIQLVLLHLRKYQIMLAIWAFLFGVVNGNVMRTFGAYSLFLAPEYLGNVNALSASIVGACVAFFIISWNITTFILFSRHIRFLSATSNPFLKYCVNNCIIPAAFVLFYLVKLVIFLGDKELIKPSEIVFIICGFFCGLVLILALSFYYFFRADKTIFRRMLPVYNNPKTYITHLRHEATVMHESHLMQAKWYFDSPFKIRRIRNVNHYTLEFINTIFKQHHFAAVLGILLVFLGLVVISFFLDSPFFQIPAAASITLLFAMLICTVGAFYYFLQSWSIPVFIFLYLGINFAVQKGWLDASHKAFGLNYKNLQERPKYTPDYINAMCTPEKMMQDKKNMIGILNRWKSHQASEKPKLVLLNVSGGGLRSSTFTFKMLQQIDSATNGGLMNQVFLINGASGGMMGATYFRELYLQKKIGKNVDLQDNQYLRNISGDLLNPLFSSFVIRDILSPVQKFDMGKLDFTKDRGYAFEEKLNTNTHYILNKQLKDYTAYEKEAFIPLMFFSSVITRDSRKLLISTQPIRFMMKDSFRVSQSVVVHPDAIDFCSFFSKQNPQNLRLLTAIRMNASFPVVLPNVWLPSSPVIDVLDAGLRDNFGIETSIRFLNVFHDWIKENTSGVLLLQIKDRRSGGWEFPYDATNIAQQFSKPLLMLQYNMFKSMDYVQNIMLKNYQTDTAIHVSRLIFEYASKSDTERAALSFKLNESEKRMIRDAAYTPDNLKKLNEINELLK